MKHGARISGVAAAFWLALGAAGCATTPAPAPGTVTSPMPGHGAEPVHSTETGTSSVPTPPPVPPPMQVGSTASGGTITQTGSPSDSGPSADAQAVLRTIPDPVAGSESGQSMPVPAGNAGGAGAAGVGVTGSTGGGAAGAAGAAGAGAALAAASRPDSAQTDTSSVAVADSASMPTPSLTEPLGEHPGAHVVTDPAPGTPTGTAQAPPPAVAAPASPAPPNPCYRVQVAAVPEHARAKALRDAAQSQLMTDFVIEVEKKLYKVRTKDCLTAEAADRIKQHAIDDGFAGAFRFKPTK